MKNTLLLTALLSSTILTTHAQTTTLPEVLTTATRTERGLLDALSSADVLRGTSLTQSQPQSLGQALQTLPNAGVQVGTRKSVEQLNIRGLDDRRVVLKVDGQRRNFRGEYKGRTFLSPSLLKQVEVVRGAGSVLQGSGALAGVVNIVTKDAADYLAAGQKVGYATEAFGGTNGGSLGANVAVAGRTNTLDLLAFQELSSMGNVRLGRDVELPQSNLNTRQSFVKGTYTPTDATAIQVALANSYDRGDSTSNPVRKAPFAGLNTDRRADQNDARVKITHSPSGNPLVDVAAQAYFGQTMITEVVTQNGASKGRRDKTRYTNKGLDLQNTSRFTAVGLNHAVTLGAEYGTDDQRGVRPGTNRKELFPNADSTNWAVFAQNEMTQEKWDLAPGVRYEHYELKGDTLNRSNQKGQATAKLAAGYRLSDATRLFASLGQGFRAPLLTEAFSGGTLGGPLTLIPNANLKPEKSLTAEVGANHVRTLGWDGDDQLVLRGALFHTMLKDLIERQSINATQFQFRNVPKAETYGTELSAAYTGQTWFGNAAVGYTRGENKTANQPLLDVPPLKLNTTLGRTAEHQVGTWRTGWTMEAATNQTRVPRNDLLVSASKGYVVHGLFTELKPKQRMFREMTIGLAADNVFDKRYRRVTSFLDETGLDVRAKLSIKF
ncbi:MAG: TonB-dependent receptor [Alphaproteobacteria bacterium]|nr:TonB-dependent receptor [Alphaproteobacteria bacterium]